MSKPKIQVILGSIREGRSGEKVANWFMEAIKDNQNAEVELVDLRDYPLPLYADSDAVKNREGAHPIAAVQTWIDKISEAQGYVFITPEYNHSYSSAIKNAIDYAYKAWNAKPLGLVGYGGYAGGSRAVEHLRQVAAELQMYDIRNQIVIPAVWAAFNAEGKLENHDSHAKNANAVIDKLAQLVGKL